MVKTKVFVGNLSFKTLDSDLVREFEVAGKVSTANIITRGNRSLGYGFVEMESEEEANKAVQLLSKKQIDGREINVEVAKPREEGAAQAPRAPRPRRAPRPQGANGGNGAAPGAEGEGQGETAARRRRPQRRVRRPRQNADGTPAEGGQVGQNNNNNNNNNGAPRQRRERPPRQPRPEGDRPPRVATPNTLFVANLPFTVDDAALSQIFAGLNVKSAHVVRKRNQRSKGFGFVAFNTEDDQKKALTAVDKKNVEGRELTVKVATSEPQAKEGDQPKDAASAVKNANAGAPASPKPNQQQQ